MTFAARCKVGDKANLCAERLQHDDWKKAGSPEMWVRLLTREIDSGLLAFHLDMDVGYGRIRIVRNDVVIGTGSYHDPVICEDESWTAVGFSEFYQGRPMLAVCETERAFASD